MSGSNLLAEQFKEKETGLGESKLRAGLHNMPQEWQCPQFTSETEGSVKQLSLLKHSQEPTSEDAAQ